MDLVADTPWQEQRGGLMARTGQCYCCDASQRLPQPNPGLWGVQFPQSLRSPRCWVRPCAQGVSLSQSYFGRKWGWCPSLPGMSPTWGWVALVLLCQPCSAAPTHFWFLNELLPCVIYNDVLLWSWSGHPTERFYHQLKGLRPRSVLVAQGQRKRELGQLYLVRTIVANVTFIPNGN